MSKKHKLSVYIFRRDLRLQDNTALLKACEESQEVIPIFILNDNQVTDKNEYKSNNSLQFLFNSLRELNEELKKKDSQLYLFHGNQIQILKDLINIQNISAIYQNKDYTPYARGRDKKIKELCEKEKIDFNLFDDYMLNNPKKVFTNSGDPYKVFTPYFRAAQRFEIPKPHENHYSNYFSKSISLTTSYEILTKLLPQENKHIFRKGGRPEALSILRDMEKYEDYDTQRNIPSENGTTGLSAHLKFGTISVREVYDKIKTTFNENHTLIQQLYWRDFWQQISYHFPHVYGESFKKKYDEINWSYNKELFGKWCKGKTGFPIVDAGMRQLNTTGYMHNRVRMIVASFLTKDLHIDWRLGEKYFAQHLVDYDPALNNGNWQWAASTGTDAQPYFRIFNPWRQQERFDKDAIYIKRWVEELKKLDAKQIKEIEKYGSPIDKYPNPIVEHSEVATQAKTMFKEIN